MNETRTSALQSWLATEHARLHVVAAWPESARKQTLLIAIRSSIAMLMTDSAATSFRCVACPTEAR
jgi:hypothetical protein